MKRLLRASFRLLVCEEELAHHHHHDARRGNKIGPAYRPPSPDNENKIVPLLHVFPRTQTTTTRGSATTTTTIIANKAAASNISSGSRWSRTKTSGEPAHHLDSPNSLLATSRLAACVLPVFSPSPALSPLLFASSSFSVSSVSSVPSVSAIPLPLRDSALRPSRPL